MENNKKIKKYIEFSDLNKFDKGQVVYISRIEILNKMAEMQIQGEQDSYKINIMRKTFDKLYSENDEFIRPLAFVGMKASEIRPQVMKALERVGLKDKARSFPGELSGGEQQRVCITRAIVHRPKLLICDEPTGNLDPETSKEIMKVIEGVNKDLGTTIIMATHDKDIVNRMKKRVLLIEHGVLAGDYAKGSYKTHEGN